jgi:3-methyladenine DNA glycosylase AlkD
VGDRSESVAAANGDHRPVGWALRQYARTDPTWVETFIGAREDRRSGLSKREARKHLPRRP